MAIGKKNSTGGGGTGTGVFEPVEDITALKALDTSNATTWKDKWTIIVEGEGNWYRLDRESVVAESLPKIITAPFIHGDFNTIGITNFAFIRYF